MRGYPNCACKNVCGDVREEDDKPRAQCKGLLIVRDDELRIARDRLATASEGEQS